MNETDFSQLASKWTRNLKKINSQNRFNLFLLKLDLYRLLRETKCYIPFAMQLQQYYYNYKKEKCENILEKLLLDGGEENLLWNFAYEKYECYTFGSKFGRAYNKENRDWCLEQAKMYSIKDKDLPSLIWSGEINPKLKKVWLISYIEHYLLGSMMIGFNILMFAIILQGLLNFKNPSLFNKFVFIYSSLCMTMLCNAFYYPQSIGMYKVKRRYKHNENVI